MKLLVIINVGVTVVGLVLIPMFEVEKMSPDVGCNLTACRRIFQFILPRIDLQISNNKSSISMICFSDDKNFRLNGSVMDQNVSYLWVSGKSLVGEFTCYRILYTN
jgi:hypothetical protein